VIKSFVSVISPSLPPPPIAAAFFFALVHACTKQFGATWTDQAAESGVLSPDLERVLDIMLA
jgi:hypothetical protein